MAQYAKDDFIAIIADMTIDGECLEHGPDCEELFPDSCEYYDMVSDDAVETLNILIATARRLYKEEHG